MTFSELLELGQLTANKIDSPRLAELKAKSHQFNAPKIKTCPSDGRNGGSFVDGLDD